MAEEGKATPSPKGQPKFLVLDADSLAGDDVGLLREHVRLTRIEFHFPEGLADVPVYEECRALTNTEDFDVMYDLTMQYLAGKHLMIVIKDDDGTKRCLGQCHVTDKYQDLRIMGCVSEYPYLVNWLVEFMAGALSKRFPLPLPNLKPQAAEKNLLKKMKKNLSLRKKQ